MSSLNMILTFANVRRKKNGDNSLIMGFLGETYETVLLNVTLKFM